MTDTGATVLGFDIGSKRIGVSRANTSVRFASPLTTLQDPPRFVGDIIALCRQEHPAYLVFGLPRGIEGQQTAQTARVKGFADQVLQALSDSDQQIPLYWTDEALTSVRAKSELAEKHGSDYRKSDVDALAATYILEDFLKEKHDNV